MLQTDLAAESSSLLIDAEKIVGLINEAILQTRHIAVGFDPVGIEVGGLPAALQQLAQNTSKMNPSVACIVDWNLDRADIDKAISQALFCIARESILNAIRHGGAERVELELGLAADARVFLQVRDNGNGFTPEAKLSAGMGIRIMKYRANSIGGELTITSAPGKGAVIRCLATASAAH